jgi:hypothetical protein
VRQHATRGAIGLGLKTIVIKVVQTAADKAASLLLPKLAEAFEKRVWQKRGLKEGWLRVTKDSLAGGALESAKPTSPERSLLFIHGPFSDAASAYRELASSSFFDRVKDTYADRIFAFNHFSVSRTPEQNARMLLSGLPEQSTTFDVVTHSRGGLVLRNIVERAKQFGICIGTSSVARCCGVAERGHAARDAETVGRDHRLAANLLELFPDTPSTGGHS